MIAAGLQRPWPFTIRRLVSQHLELDGVALNGRILAYHRKNLFPGPRIESDRTRGIG
jgi:hypothetical protein